MLARSVRDLSALSPSDFRDCYHSPPRDVT